MANERLTQPVAEFGGAQPQHVPGSPRDFSFRDRKDYIETPVDELTGLPYPIAPSGDFLPKGKPEIADRHHHFHPASDLRLQSLGGRALRSSRLQLVNIYDHNRGPGTYHNFYGGPPLPRRPIEQFKTCVYACAGYIPNNGIDMSSGEPKIVELSPKQMNWLRTVEPGNNFGYRNMWYDFSPVRKFFTKFALAQDFSELDKRTIEQFLTTEDEKLKQKLARRLIYQAAHLAVDGLKEDYNEIHKAGRLDERLKADPGLLVYSRIRSRKMKPHLEAFVQKKAKLALAA